MPSTPSSSDLHSFWQRHISDWQRSGVNKARFCREQDLNYHQFIYWLSKLTAQACIDDTAPQRRKLLPVTIEQRQHSAGLKIMLPNGVTISGITKDSAQLLSTVLAQL